MEFRFVAEPAVVAFNFPSKFLCTLQFLHALTFLRDEMRRKVQKLASHLSIKGAQQTQSHRDAF